MQAKNQGSKNITKQPNATMKKTMKCDNAPKQAIAVAKKQNSDCANSWKYKHFEFISSKSKNTVVHSMLCAGNKFLIN